MPSRILGISAFYHDSAAALVVDGSVVAAAQGYLVSQNRKWFMPILCLWQRSKPGRFEILELDSTSSLSVPATENAL